MLEGKIISNKNTYQPAIDSSKCVQCGRCISACWRGVYQMTAEGIVIDQQRLLSCIGCQECYKQCPTGALELTDVFYKTLPMEINNFYDLVEARQSCRDFTKKEVAREDLVKLAELVCLAPTIRNAQQFKMIIIDEPGLRKKFAEKVICYQGAQNNSFAKIDLPSFVLFVREKIKPGQINTAKDGFEINFDMGCLGAHFILGAADLGLATCLIGRFDNEAAEALFGLEAGCAAFVVAIGYPAKEYVRLKYRKKFDEVISFNKYE